MIACKRVINGKTVTPNACLCWPDFSVYHFKIVSAVPVHRVGRNAKDCLEATTTLYLYKCSFHGDNFLTP